MKLVFLKLIALAIFLLNVSNIKTVSVSNTVFDLLNQNLGHSSYQPQSYDNFRFMSFHSNNGTGNSTTAGSNSTATPAPDSYVINLNDPNTQINDWLSISSPSFANIYKYPQLNSADGKRALIDLNNYERQNGNFINAQK
jgi:hypothetical protein